MVFSPFDDSQLLVASEDGRIREWRIPAGGLKDQLTEPHRFVRLPVVAAISGGLKDQLTEPHRFVRPPVVAVIAGGLKDQLTEPHRFVRPPVVAAIAGG